MLHNMQSDFMAALLATEPQRSVPRPVPPTLNIKPGSLTPERRIGIYRRNMLAALRGALGAIFPTTKSIMGVTAFLVAADYFIHEIPSTSGNLNEFGRDFPEFLHEQQLVLAAMPPYRDAHAGVANAIVDMARLDWAWHEAFHAAEHASLDLSRLAAIPSEQHAALAFALHPSACLIESAYPLFEIWRQYQPEYDGSATIINPHLAAEEKSFSAEHFLVVHRGEADVTLTPLAKAQYFFLAHCARQNTLGEATEAALQIDHNFALQAFLIACVQQNIIVDFALQT